MLTTWSELKLRQPGHGLMPYRTGCGYHSPCQSPRPRWPSWCPGYYVRPAQQAGRGGELAGGQLADRGGEAAAVIGGVTGFDLVVVSHLGQAAVHVAGAAGGGHLGEAGVVSTAEDLVGSYSGADVGGASQEMASFQLLVALTDMSAMSMFRGMPGAEVLAVKVVDAAVA